MTCIACGESTPVSEFLAVRDLFFGHEGEWQYVKCTSCDSWSSEPIAAAELEEAYSSYYTHSERASRSQKLDQVIQGPASPVVAPLIRAGWAASNSNGSNSARIDRVRGFFGFLAPRSKQDRFLDVGCGAGEMLSRLASLGVSCVGIEPDEKAAELARKRGHQVFVGDAMTSFDHEGFDAILLHHVIEHVENPEGVLAHLISLLRPGGQLVFVCPNPSSLVAGAFGTGWRGWEAPRHRHLVSPGGFRVMAERVCSSEQVEVRTSCRSTRSMVAKSSGSPVDLDLVLAQQAEQFAHGMDVGDEIVGSIRVGPI